MLSEVVLKEVENFLYMKCKNTRENYKFAWQKWVARPTHDRESALKMFREFKDLNHSDNTIRIRLYSLKSIYEYLLDFGLVDENPFRAVARVVKKRAPQQVRPTALIPFSKVNDIVNSGKCDRDKALLAVLFGCGLRRGELVNLRLSDICISNNGTYYFQLRQTKNGAAQQQPIPYWVLQLVQKLVLKRKAETRDINAKLFVSYKHQTPLREMLPHRAYKIYKRYLARFGINAAPHSARTTSATYLKSLGYQDREVATFLRHTNTAMVQAYDKRRLGIEQNPGKTIKY